MSPQNSRLDAVAEQQGQAVELSGMQQRPEFAEALLEHRVIGGANVTWMASENVGIFVESGVNLKNLFWKEGGAFAFNTASFGIKFMPKPGKLRTGDLDVNVGASAPAGTNYWMYHFGSIMGQANYYH